jgi:hypothetical protein
MQTSDAAYGRGGGAWEQALGQTLARRRGEPRPRRIRREEYPEARCLRCITDMTLRSATSVCKKVAEIEMFRFEMIAGIMHVTVMARMNVCIREDSRTCIR